MFVIEVIPLTTLPPQVPQLLSYFFNKPLPKGSIVEVSVNNRKIIAIVTSSSSIEKQKLLLKKINFQLKKVSSIVDENPAVTDTQFKIAIWLAKNYFISLGLAFKTVLPAFFGNPRYPFSYPKVNLTADKKDSLQPELLLIRSKDITDKLRLEIKRILNQRKQVLMIVPEISLAKYFYGVLNRQYKASILHSGIGVKKNHQEWERISSGQTELVIGARQALFAPFRDLGLIIIEDPANDAYKSDMSPKYFTRDIALKIAEIYSARLLFISQTMDVVGYSAVKDKIYKFSDQRGALKTDLITIDMLQEIRSGNFTVFSREFKNNIEKYLRDNKKILIFSGRKDYSSSLICENCEFIFKCPNCSLSLRVHKSSEQLFICHRCSITQKMPKECPNCHSYKLKKAGFSGSEKIKEELEGILKNFKKQDIFMLDLNSMKNPKAESELTQKIEESDSCICIATQAIFSHRFSLKFDLIGISNLDSLTTMPDFRAEEYLFIQFEKLLDFEPEKLIIQSYNPNSQLPALLASRNYEDFYYKELQVRSLFGYPPFTRLVKLSFSSLDKNKAGYEARLLSEKLKMAIVQEKLGGKVELLDPSPAFVEKEKNRYIYNLILKATPQYPVGEILKFVLSNWSIDIDPRSIL